MVIGFPSWMFYILGVVGVIVSVGLTTWAVIRVERQKSERLDKR